MVSFASPFSRPRRSKGIFFTPWLALPVSTQGGVTSQMPRQAKPGHDSRRPASEYFTGCVSPGLSANVLRQPNLSVASLKGVRQCLFQQFLPSPKRLEITEKQRL